LSAESKRLALLGPVQWQLSDTYQACCRKRCRLTTLEDSVRNVRGQECQPRDELGKRSGTPAMMLTDTMAPGTQAHIYEAITPVVTPKH